MDWEDEVGIADAPDGIGVVAYLHLCEGMWGLRERRFPTLLEAYRLIRENVSGITQSELHALYRPTGAKLMSRLVANREEWAKFFEPPGSVKKA